MPLNKIFVVFDPTAETQPAFERALDSARETGAALHIYCCVNDASGFAGPDAAQRDLQPRLESLTQRGVDAGHSTANELEWAQDWPRQVVSAAARSGASMIFKDSIDHSAVDRELRQTADWTLLRMAPCPVLMVKNFHDWQHRRVLAAVNPTSTEQAHIKLDHQVTALAQQFAATYGSDAHFVTAFSNLNHVPDAAAIAQTCGVEEEHVHLRQGKAADVIRDVAQELDVDLIIVGTVGRDGIKGRVIGNTCERLLDQTHSDVLVLN
ncbi:MAG: universal stress protein [Halioglobus sp.]|nr:universal stress protein [Halioglobus sp.]